MKKFVLYVIFLSVHLLFYSIFSYAQQKPIYYSGAEEFEVEYDQLSYLATGDSVLTIDAAKDYSNSGSFLINTKKSLNLGIAKDNYWLRIRLINKQPKRHELLLNLENPRLNEADIYLIKGNLTPIFFRIGDNFNFFTRPVHYNQFAVPFTLEATDTLDIYILLKHKGNTLQLPISILTYNSFHKKVETNYLVIGLIAGIFLLTLFFSIFLYLKSFSRLFLLYILYLISILLWLLSTEGYGFQFLWPNQPEWATRFGPGFSVFNLTTFILVALEFCKPYDSTKWIRRVLYGIAGLTFLWGLQAFMPYINISNTSLMSFFLFTSFTIYIISLFLMMIYLLYVSIKKNRLVFYYFFAVIVSVIFSLLVVARHSGWIDFPLTSGTFASIGVVFEIILMTLGIANQFFEYKKEKEEMLIQYLKQQKSITEQIVNTQEQERKRISREMHDDIGAGLTQITLISESIRKKVGNASEKEINDIAVTSRKLVSNMSEIIWSMNPENRTLGLLVSYLREELGKLLEYSGLEYSLDLPETDREIVLPNMQLRNIILVAKEIVNNSIKHSNAKKINIKFLKTSNNLIGYIEDDGCGFNPDQKNNGNGLKNIRQRVKESGGTLTISTGIEGGSFFEFNFPLNSTT